MKRTLILLAAVVGFATTANAASITVASDKATYLVGETIVLTVTGFTESSAEQAVALFAKLTYDAALTTGVSGMQTPHTTMNGMMALFAGFAGPTEDGGAHLLDQVVGLSAASVDPFPATTIGTVTLVADDVGTVLVNFFVNPGDTLSLNYFGITSAPGTSFLIIIPEPTTAALIGLGLIGLVLGGRRRA